MVTAPRERHPPRRPARGAGVVVALLALHAAGPVLPVAGAAPTAPAPAPAAAHAAYRAPVDDPAHVVRPFDPPDRPWLAGHRGVDVAAPAGTVVRAPAAGVVTFVGVVAGRGVLTVTHDDGRRSSLEPVQATVAAGARVDAGAALGVVTGPAHDAAAPAVHWGVREDDRYVDPWALLPGRGPVVLLPVT